MTWHVHISEHTYEMLRDLTPDARSGLFTLFRHLEEGDPYEIATPFGIDDDTTYTAAFTHGIVTLIINPGTRRITPLSITSL